MPAITRQLEEQRRLAGIRPLYADAVPSLAERSSETIKSAKHALKVLVSALKRRGIDTDVVGVDGWGVGSAVMQTPVGRFPVHVAFQEFPKGHNLSVSVQSPLFDAGEEAEDALRRMEKPMKGLVSKFSEFGDARFGLGDRGWPHLWVEIDADKVVDALAKAPAMMGSVAQAVAKGFEK